MGSTAMSCSMGMPPQVPAVAAGGPSPSPIQAPPTAGADGLVQALQGLVTALQGLVQALQGQMAVQGGGAGAPGADACMGAASMGASGGAAAAPDPIVQSAPPATTASPAQVPPGIKGAGSLKVKGKGMDAEQIANVNAVLAVGKEMGANDKVMRAAVATMIQESVLHNLNYGDRDSLGLFQQRPSMGWGTPEQVRDPRHAARKFFERAIPSDQKKPQQSIAQLSQSVQRSAFPDAYARWEGEAGAIVSAWKAGT